MTLYAILLSCLGLGFIYLEFFLPGAVMASIGLIAILSGALLLGLSDAGYMIAFLYLIGNALIALLVCLIALKKVRRSAKRDTFFLSKDQQGYSATEMDSALIGSVGAARTDMKPSGHIQIGGRQYPALSERGYITAGESIEVVGVRSGYYLVVPHKKM